ncbi:MAG: hypothetical protein SGPRY_003957, partial [Prymnesium sp.]
ETERLEAEAERLSREKPCDWCRQAATVDCTLCGNKTVHHFCMNEMVPVLRTGMSLRLCIECAKTETPGILAQLVTSQVQLLFVISSKFSKNPLVSSKDFEAGISSKKSSEK